MTAVYILISNGDDLFYEQLLVSLYSLRMHNPELNVVVLVDEKNGEDTTWQTFKSSGTGK